MRRSFIGFAVPVTALALAASACTSAGTTATTAGGSGSGSGAASGAAKDELVLAYETDPYGWDPSNQPGFQNWAAEAIWDQLVFCDANGQLEPGVAETWEISDDNTTFTAHLREGQTFSDGSPVDSATVEASFEFVKENGGGTADYEDITIETPDAQTFVVAWPDPQPVLNSKLCNPKIAPATYLEAGEFDAPVGSGPYVLDAAATTTGSTYTFTKNAEHWNTANYPFQTLVIKVLTDAAAATAAMKTGQVDAGLVGQNDLASVEAAGYQVVNFQGQSTRLIISDRTGDVLEPLGELKVRQAMNMVFDKEAMAASLYQGNAELTPQVFRKGTAAYIDGMADPYPFDVEKAKALMAEAGYADGFALELPTMEGQNFETLMPYVVQQLAQINISVKQVPLSGANAIGDLLSGKYPVVLWQVGNLGLSALQIYIEMTPDGWWNLQHQSDEYVDSRFAQIATADEATSATLQQEINQYVVDQAWFAPMVYTGTHFAHSADVSIPTQSDQEALTPKLRDFK